MSTIWHLEEYEHRDERVFAFLFLVALNGSSIVVGLGDKIMPSFSC